MDYFKNGTAIADWEIQDYISFTQAKILNNNTDELTNSTDKPDCRFQTSPPNDFTNYLNYREENKLYVCLCFWKEGMIQLLSERI
jgi:hypothetical protein